MGKYNDLIKQTITVIPSTISQTIVKTDSNCEVLGEVIVKPISAEVDNNIKPENIAKGISILGINGTYDGMTQEIYDILNSILDKTISSFSDSEITKIGDSIFSQCSSLSQVSIPNCSYIGEDAFGDCTSLTTADFPNCTYVDYAAFVGCTSLLSVSFPNCSYIGGHAFAFCNSLTTVDCPNCTYIGGYAFYSCSSLTSVNIPNCTYVDNYAFAFCNSLTTVDCPNCTYIGTSAFYKCSALPSKNGCRYMNDTWRVLTRCLDSTITSYSDSNVTIIGGDDVFYNCTSLTSVSFPNCSYIGEAAFQSCFSLTSVNIPNCTYVYNYAFAYCMSLSSVSFPNCSYIGYYAFRNCTSLSQLYINEYSSICSLPYSYTFSCTPFASGIGSIYVPSSLVSSYKLATNWVYFSNCITAYNE